MMSISDVFLPHPHLGDRQSSSKVDSRQKRVLIMDRKKHQNSSKNSTYVTHIIHNLWTCIDLAYIN